MAASNIQTGQPVGEPWYVSLLGLAEHFRTSNPPNIKNCIHCLQSILTFKPSPRIAARVQLQLGTVLFQHTKNSDLAMKYLEAAWTTSQTIQSFEDVKFEAASMLARMCAKQDEMDRARSLLRKAVEMSQPVPYWHCRLLFQLAEIHSAERDYSTACVLLGLGIDYASVQGSEYTKLLFMLSKAMLLLISKQLQEVHQVLSTAGSCIEAWHTDSQAQKENLKVFFLVLQVCHYLLHGQVKSVKPALKQLQQSIQALSNMQTDDGIFYSTNRMEHFQWLSKEHLCVLVYLVTVMHSMQAGYMDKAQKYTDKALMQIEKLKMLDSHPLLSSFQMMLLEHIILCRLIMGNKSTAIQEISQACQLCQQQPRLLTSHRAQLHTLLGLYAMSMNCMEAAEAQFNTSLMNTGDLELSSFVYLHLAIVYIRTGRQGEMAALLQRLDPDRLQSGSHSLKASTYFVRGLQSFCGTRYSEAKKYLRETLKMANAEDLNRLTSCSLVLLGHVFLSLGNSQEALNMVTPAMQLASKIPDVHVQLWASSLLKDLYRVCGNHQRESESTQMHENFTQALLHDHFQASQLTEHQLIHWTQGECPAGISGASSSQHLGAAPVMGSSSSSTETSGSTDGASNTL